MGSGLPSHWKVVWVETPTNWGVTEGGSSGSPIFDEQGRIVGSLSGGLASCANPEGPDYYGKFSYHWESNGNHDTTRLKPWLDPDDTGTVILDGSTMGEQENNVHIAKELLVYPNPVLDDLNIQFISGEPSAIQFDIVNLMGETEQSVYVHSSLNEYRIKVDHLKPGIYFIRKSELDHSVVTKFIKR